VAKPTKSVKQLLNQIMAIQIGTSGWHAVVTPETSFARVRSESAGGASDRLGLFNADGSLTSPNQSMALFFDYLVESRKWTSGGARSVATSNLADRGAEARGLPVYETPVSFKYIGETINEDKIVVGGKDSAGFSNEGHDPEKDGILACLLATKAVTSCGARLNEQVNQQYLGRI
jgi:phosphoglucomutase